MKHVMHLYKGPFQKIYSGKKTIELRMYDDKRRAIKEGEISHSFMKRTLK